MWISKKKWKALEGKVADLETEVKCAHIAIYLIQEAVNSGKKIKVMEKRGESDGSGYIGKNG